MTPTKDEIDAEIDGWLADSEESRRLRQKAMRREIDEALAHFRAELKTELEVFREALRQEIKTELRLNLKTIYKQTQCVLREAAESAALQTKTYVQMLCQNPVIEE